jgi:hypothetical protein
MADRISNSVPVPNPRAIPKVLYNRNIPNALGGVLNQPLPPALGGVLSTNSSGRSILRAAGGVLNIFFGN